MTATPEAEPRFTLSQLGLARSPDPDVRAQTDALLAQADARFDETAYLRLRREYGIEPEGRALGADR